MTGSSVGQLSYLDAASTLAGRVLGAFQGVGVLGLADFLDSCADVKAGLGAVRLVGADVFAPRLLLGRSLDARDLAVVTDSLAVFPAVARPATQEQLVVAWRDWATTQLLSRLTDASAHPAPDAGGVLGPVADWPRWSVVVAQLSSLALPALDGPVARVVAHEPRALARGACRAVLRRDHATAARLVRWVALLHGAGVELPFDAALLVEHIRLNAGTGPRLLLDLAVARHLLEAEPA